jgi:hypothetical protein
MTDIPSKPDIYVQRIVGLQVLQGWSKEKIINWWKADDNTVSCEHHREFVIKWLDYILDNVNVKTKEQSNENN